VKIEVEEGSLIYLFKVGSTLGVQAVTSHAVTVTVKLKIRQTVVYPDVLRHCFT
jgi:hypothetical protein